MNHTDRWRELGQQLRVDSVRSSAAAGSGHPTSSMSAADLMGVLLSKYLRYDFDNPDNPNNDHLIFSKGHASPLLYALYKAAGAISDEEMLTFRKFGSRLQGHPTPAIKWVDVATGSLGQGLPIGVGVAIAGKRLDKLPYRVWVLCGDSEMAEGSMWEAFQYAGFSGLDNLTAIVDVNRLGQRGETMLGWDTGRYADRARAFGWNAIEIDGHDGNQIDGAYAEALATDGMPTVILARTLKGKGVSSVEDVDGVHGKAISNADEAIEELGGLRSIIVNVSAPENGATPNVFPVGHRSRPVYEVGDEVATRKAYGDALVALGYERNDVVAVDGEVSNSTYTEFFAEAHPDRYIEMYIAEQQMVATAVGLQVRNWICFASTFAAFLSRAYDFIRMAAISQANLRLIGSHAGVSIGEDGPSQMGLEDIATMRAIHGSVVLYPADANQAAKLVPMMADQSGIVYMRTTREPLPVIYGADQEFTIGGSHIVRSSDNDDVTIVAAGITVHEALKAADALSECGVNACVIDMYSVKPIDAETLKMAVADTGLLVTVEDHWCEGGLGEAVLHVFAYAKERPPIKVLAVRDMPKSGPAADLLKAAGIDADHIVVAVRNLLAEHGSSLPR